MGCSGKVIVAVIRLGSVQRCILGRIASLDTFLFLYQTFSVMEWNWLYCTIVNGVRWHFKEAIDTPSFFLIDNRDQPQFTLTGVTVCVFGSWGQVSKV